MDIGTNTEISVFDSGELHSASCASGPAFEGGMLSCGMRAVPGAVTSVHIENGKLSLETDWPNRSRPASAAPVWCRCCRSWYARGAINARGRLSAAFPGVREQAHKREFLLANHRENGALPVVFTQEDIRAVQLAKGGDSHGLGIAFGGNWCRRGRCRSPHHCRRFRQVSGRECGAGDRSSAARFCWPDRAGGQRSRGGGSTDAGLRGTPAKRRAHWRSRHNTLSWRHSPDSTVRSLAGPHFERRQGVQTVSRATEGITRQELNESPELVQVWVKATREFGQYERRLH